MFARADLTRGDARSRDKTGSCGSVETIFWKRMIVGFLIFSTVHAGRIFGNRYSGRSGTAEVVVVPPQGHVFWTPKSCLYVPHT